MSNKILLVGRPNVGKSSLFNCLSDSYAVVSNYPGTTVGVTKGNYHSKTNEILPILDLPGMYHFVPITDEEKVASHAILGVNEKISSKNKSNGHCDTNDSSIATDKTIIIHVVEASKLPVHLPFTILLKNLGKPIILAINMADEARAKKIKIDYQKIQERLGLPVVPISAINKEGIDKLKDQIDLLINNKFNIPDAIWPNDMMSSIQENESTELKKLSEDWQISVEMIWLLLQEGGDINETFHANTQFDIIKARKLFEEKHSKAQVYFYTFFRQQAEILLQDIYIQQSTLIAFREKLSNLMIKPWFGIPLLFLILYLGLYQFVGVFGAGTVVGWIEENLFGEYITPHVTNFFKLFLTEENIFFKLFVGEYGLFTLGITYAFALVLPVVFFFFLVFSVVEDSGYFPRLALLIDKVFKLIGLNGRAVIPLVLGLGCDTMATITTRTLESKKERIIATFLLALAVPCSAQLGLITGIMADFGFMIWLSYIAIILFVLFLFGYLSKKIIKGDGALFFMELPPLRMPKISNVLIKSFSRMKWYFFEVVPLFLYASLILWLLDISGGIDLLKVALVPLMGFIGLPESAAESFLIGFFRRDYGAAGLFHLAQEQKGLLSAAQMLVGAVTLTLFVPCVAQFMIMWKERGPKIATILFTIITTIAFLSGGILFRLLHLFGAKI